MEDSDVQFLNDFDKSDIVLVNWAEVRQKPLVEADPTSSPYSGSVSSGPTSAAVSSDEEQEEDYTGSPGPMTGVSEDLLKDDQSPYRELTQSKRVRILENGKKLLYQFDN